MHKISTETDRAKITIQDCGELLIYLPDFLSKNNSHIQLQVGAIYGAQNLENYKLRQSAAERLLQAEQYLQQHEANLTLQLTDAYRPLALQRQYFNDIREKFLQQGLTGQELYNRVVLVIADPDLCPPHTTGGTVDVTLYHLENKQAVDMGCAIDDIEHPARFLWYTDVSAQAKQYRQLLFDAMRSAGFAEDEAEWWHYSYGDQQWALVYNQLYAIYGSI